MTEIPGVPPRGQPGPVLRDWITIWQSELSAAATDPELVQAWTKLVALWATGARAATTLLPPPPQGAADDAARRAGSAASSGSAPADAAPDAGDAAQARLIERLARRVEDLERRLAGLEGSGGPG
jgi:hypothetical protein